MNTSTTAETTTQTTSPKKSPSSVVTIVALLALSFGIIGVASVGIDRALPGGDGSSSASFCADYGKAYPSIDAAADAMSTPTDEQVHAAIDAVDGLIDGAPEQIVPSAGGQQGPVAITVKDDLKDLKGQLEDGGDTSWTFAQIDAEIGLFVCS